MRNSRSDGAGADINTELTDSLSSYTTEYKICGFPAFPFRIGTVAAFRASQAIGGQCTDFGYDKMVPFGMKA
ncbi:hypothetical protein [Rubripirellula amarantea]|nr:hypothetical protein [Rubripirellula amarantea]